MQIPFSVMIHIVFKHKPLSFFTAIFLVYNTLRYGFIPLSESGVANYDNRYILLYYFGSEAVYSHVNCSYFLLSDFRIQASIILDWF